MRSKTFRRTYAGTFVALVGVLALSQGAALMFGEGGTTDSASSSRQLLSSGGEVIPGFSGACDKMASWEEDHFAILHVIACIYLFLGIAIICDEQFTSSLESICNPRTGLGLSPDVAGATFMAAGSSAPELASSFMGTFVSKSDVGLGTIIGSAVFNILIIIGATAIVVGEPMQLDWKPLGRDVCFYLGSVTILIAFVAGDNLIDWYEALILLLYYGMYIAFMTQNTHFMRWLSKFIGEEKEKKSSHSRRPSFSTGTWHKDKDKQDGPEGKYAPTEGGDDSGAASDAAGAGSGVGVAIAELQDDSLPGTPMGTSGAAVPTMGSAAGSGTGSGDGTLPALPNAAPALPSMGAAPALPGAVLPAAAEPAADLEKGAVEDSAEAKVEEPAADSKEEGKEEEEEEEGPLDKVLMVLSLPYELAFNYTMPDCKYEDPSDEDADEAIGELEEEAKAATPERAKEIEEEIALLEKQKQLRGEIEEAEDNEDDAKVAELQKQLFDSYEPLTSNQKLYLVTFTVSLIWITVLSYFMVTLMEKIGCAWGISSFIMGITFLAMGTSVPDALGSIAVAKEGEGDMAVSNAIGSNVFDICIGLGLPWLLATLIDGEGRVINAATESIVASASILFLVVVVLFGALFTSTHPETGYRFCLYPVVGYILFASYAAFVIFQICWTATGQPE